jgi:hypothetical protein
MDDHKRNGDRSVLVVEDDREINELVGAYAQIAGFELIRTAGSNVLVVGRTAVSRLAQLTTIPAVRYVVTAR